MTVREKQCTRCNETKPINEFKRRLTIAQSRAMLRNPKINKAYVTTSTNCASCRKENKRRTPLSTKEIRTKISTGDLHKTIGEAMLEERRKAIPETRSRVMKEYWAKKKTEWVTPLKAKIQRQVAKYKNRYQAYRRNLEKSNEAGKPSTTTQHAKLIQHSWNYKEAQRVRDEVFKKIDQGTKYPSTFHIQTLIKPMKYNQGENDEAL